MLVPHQACLSRSEPIFDASYTALFKHAQVQSKASLACEDEGVGKSAPVSWQPFALQMLDGWKGDPFSCPHQAPAGQHHIHRLGGGCHGCQHGEDGPGHHAQPQDELGSVARRQVPTTDVGHCIAHKEHTARAEDLRHQMCCRVRLVRPANLHNG